MRYRLIDLSGEEIGIIQDDRPEIQLGERVQLPDGSTRLVLNLFDDPQGREGGVQATLAVDETGQ